ncbi:MAG TPA: SIS domain-containing protein [Deltaproteobacteria bacterium]|nr:SIS domain-containing protein [Deltaproteobacteria bacterium]
MRFQEFAKEYIDSLNGLLGSFDTEAFDRIVNSILDAYSDETAIFIMGNGGSASTASHFACDINKGCCLDLDKKFKVICLNDNIPTLLAYANDLDYASVFVEQLKNFFHSEDLVIGISGSGNSENVLRAIRYANENGGKTVGLTGYSGGKLGQLADIAYVAASDDMQKIEDVHMIIVHMIMQAVHGALHEIKD